MNKKLEILAIFSLLIFIGLKSGQGSGESKIEMVFALEPSSDYFAVPYPSDLHRRADGKVDRRDYPVPLDNPIMLHYREVSDGADGFGLSEAAFIRFSDVINSTNLPGPEESVNAASPIFMVNVSRNSPGYGERVPVYSYFHTHAEGPLKNLLAISPYPGFMMGEDTIYAAVVLRSLDERLAVSATLDALLDGKNPGGALGARAIELYKPLAQYLDEKRISPTDVAAATVFTTGDPTAGMMAIMRYVENMKPLELDSPPAPYRDHPAFYALKSSYTAPQFQTGHGSQLARGGEIIFDDNGAPIVQRREKIPVAITVPKGKMPPKGFPLVIYLHGGANTSDEFLDHIIKSKDNAFTPGEGPARVYAEQHIAGVSMAIVKNPERYGRLGMGNRFAELPFYNFFRGEVLVANHWQASADSAMLLRLMRNLRIDPKLCPQTDASASEDGMIKFDSRFFFGSGFSMGGTILGVWAGVEPGIIASIPSGASGHWGLLIRNFTWGENMEWFYTWLTGGKKGEPMDARWPAISLVQAVLEPGDTITYAPHVFQRPFPGHPARHVYLAIGRNDFYTKSITQNAIITALGLPLAGNIVEPSIMLTQKLMGFPTPLPFPLRANIKSDDGRPVTAAALQFEPDTWTNEGHNVNYNLTETKHQYGCFLRTLIDDGIPTIPPPAPEGTPCEK